VQFDGEITSWDFPENAFNRLWLSSSMWFGICYKGFRLLNNFPSVPWPASISLRNRSQFSHGCFELVGQFLVFS